MDEETEEEDRHAMDPAEARRQRREREQARFAAAGRRHLLAVQAALLAVGLLTLAVNFYLYERAADTADDLIRRAPPAVAQQLRADVRPALERDAIALMAVGGTFVLAALVLSVAPVALAKLCLVVYLATWAAQLGQLAYLFGLDVVGPATASPHTLLKLVGIAGLVFAVRVARAYEDYVLEPARRAANPDEWTQPAVD